jgi:hypothetical protein
MRTFVSLSSFDSLRTSSLQEGSPASAGENLRELIEGSCLGLGMYLHEVSLYLLKFSLTRPATNGIMIMTNVGLTIEGEKWK